MSKLSQELDPEFIRIREERDRLVEKERSHKSLLDDMRRQRDSAIKATEALNRKCDLLTSIDDLAYSEPLWLSPSDKKSMPSVHHGIANLMLSDLHLDEVVNPAEINSVNAYNRAIAVRRMQMLIERTCEVAFDFINGITYDGITVWLGGDIFSGNIHEELKATNEAPIMATVDFWVDHLVAALLTLAQEFGKVHVPGVVGNHGRNTYKPVMKNRVEDNFDWLTYRIIYRELKNDDRFTWQLPVSTDVTVRHYEHTYLMTHGDQFRGGSGISGIQTPLALGAFRKSKRQQAVGDPFDTMLLGHFHQYMTLPGVLVNGSLKGYDEYAAISNFGFEVPQQAFWVTTPERGPAFHVPIQPMNRKAEKW